MEARNGVAITSTGAIERKFGNAHMRPTETGRSDEEMDQAHIINYSKFMSQGVELQMDEA